MHAEPGLMIFVQNRVPAPLGAQILQNAFKEAGILVKVSTMADIDVGKVVLWVGPKRQTQKEYIAPH
jgi:hypothetical protein